MATEWMKIDYAIANMGEDDDRIVGIEVGNRTVQVCWWSCGNIKVATISGIDRFTSPTPEMIKTAAEFLGENSDFEVAIPVSIEGSPMMMAIDCCDCAENVDDGSIPDVDIDTEEFDASDYDSLPEDVISFYDLEV